MAYEIDFIIITNEDLIHSCSILQPNQGTL